MSGKSFIAVDEFHETCELCGNVAELRPYGPNGEEVCFACGMKDDAAAQRGFRELVLDEQAEQEGK